MPHYRVQVAAEGLRLLWEGREQRCGFRACCHVWAEDPAVAANLAAQIVRGAPELRERTGPLTSGIPVFIEEIDELPPGEYSHEMSALEYFPLSPDDRNPLSVIER